MDLNSANGTLLNGRRIDGSPHLLNEGDQVQIGRAVATYRETALEEKKEGGKPPLRHVRQKVFGAPLPTELGEADRSIFGDDRAMCGRCGAVIDIRNIKSRGKVGCKRCRAVFKRP
jgi:pSer/pThr/pTyr-binding forkhead associated (FHA) protein